MDNSKYIKACELLKENNQEHVMCMYDSLSDEGKEKLVNQILNVNFDLLKELYKSTKTEVKIEKGKIEPVKVNDKDKIVDGDKKKYIEIGEDIIKNGRFAIVTMAGGQGTRLGHNGPKGTFILNIEPPKSIFEILTEKVKVAKEKYGVNVPWYIMTSNANNDDTIKYFEDNDYFGYDKNFVKFFIQGELPMLDYSGKIILEKDGTIKLGADGNGGVFKALVDNGIIDDMQEKGIRWVYICGVDNVLVHPVDPLFIGISEYNKKMIASKSIIKNAPDEKVGVFCKKNGVPTVIEYIEVTEEMANMKDYNNEYVYGDCHIVSNMFSLDALIKIKNQKLPYHIAKKKSGYINENKEYIEPTEPNAYKFESFIFDAFEAFDDITILRIKREEEFAPVKNAEGIDSPETAIKLYMDFYNKI